MKYTTLLFDADGTLFDYDAAERAALRLALQKYGIRFTRRRLSLYRGINAEKWGLFERNAISVADLQTSRFAEMFAALGISQIDAAEFNQEYLNRLAGGAQLNAGALEVCRALSGAARLAIITNGVARTQRGRLEKSAIKPYISDLFVSEEIGRSKPDGRYFDYVFEKMGLRDKSGVLVIGDSLTSDVKGGIDYGLDVCHYRPSGASPAPSPDASPAPSPGSPHGAPPGASSDASPGRAPAQPPDASPGSPHGAPQGSSPGEFLEPTFTIRELAELPPIVLQGHIPADRGMPGG
jgi:YjjG family noncanonical pyrimidine nucleotidase